METNDIEQGRNYIILYPALLIFRNSVLPFLVERLKKFYGKGWWKAGVRRALGDKVADTLEEQYQKRYNKSLSVVNRPGDDISEMLDLNRFLPIIQANWKGNFDEVLEQRDTVEVWLREINEIRNVVAHPEKGDLSDEDTWRALDTMRRFLLLIDLTASEQIARMVGKKTEAQQERLDLLDGSYDYEKGLNILLETILQQESSESQSYSQLLELWEKLSRIVWDEKISKSSEISDRKIDALRELDQIAQNFVKASFTSLCTTKKVHLKRDEAYRQLQPLTQKIDELKTILRTKQLKKHAQTKTGEAAIIILEKEIVKTQKELEYLESELAFIKECNSPLSYFSIRRRLEPAIKENIYLEEQVIDVFIEIINEGREATNIMYEENVPTGLEIVDGSTTLATEIEPKNTKTLQYSICSNYFGKYILSTKSIKYKNRTNGWDITKDTIITINIANGPNLVASRYYQYEEDGITLITSINNDGDKLAHEVIYKEVIKLVGEQEEEIELKFMGNIKGNSNETIKYVVAITDIEKIIFPPKTIIKYKNREGEEITTVLESSIQRIEYKFPTSSDKNMELVGRDKEIDYLSSTAHDVWQAWHNNQSAVGLKNLILIEGIEGAGKTRLISRYKEIVSKIGFAVYEVDSKNRSPLKGMLKLLLQLTEDEDDEDVILEHLESHYTSIDDPRLSIVFRFLSPAHARFNDDENDALQAYVIALVKQLCGENPTLLIFENVHWVPTDGIEEQILIKLIQNLLVSKKQPTILCATYRPGDPDSRLFVDKLSLSEDFYKTIKLNPIDKGAAIELVDTIVFFPHLNKDIKDFVYEWSRGNPFYLIELLRLITNPQSEYLVAVKDEWYPYPGVNLKTAIPKTIEEVISKRVNEELSSEVNLIQTLSAIGFELPRKLIGNLVERNFPNLTQNLLYRHLDILIKAGMLLSKAGEYEFEHQLKREVLYNSLPDHKKLLLRQQVAEILLSQPVFDANEQIRQLARHLVKSPKEFQTEHLGEIIVAAKLEQDNRNFFRALEFYDVALNLVQKNSFEKVELLVERSKLYQMQGSWIAAERDLTDARKLVAPNSTLVQLDKKRAARMLVLVEKEQGRILIVRSSRPDELDRANELLYRARIGLEGNLRIKRFFLPNDFEFHRNLVEIYLALAILWLRKADYRTCSIVCRRAERVAKKALRKWPNQPILHEVYRTMGDTHYNRGKNEDLRNALEWYSKAIDFAKGDDYQQERILLRQADTYYLLDEPKQALEIYEEAIEKQKKLNDTHGLALSFGGIGNLFVEQMDYEKGKYYCEQAYQYQDLVGDIDRLWRTCLSLTKIQIKSDNIEKATEYWNQARIVLIEQGRFKKLNYRKQKEIIEMTRIFISYYREKSVSEKTQFYLNDLRIMSSTLRFEQIFEFDELVHIHVEIGESYIELQEWEKAIETFSSLLEGTNLPFAAQAELHERLGDIYKEYVPLELPDVVDWYDRPRSPLEKHYETAVVLYAKSNNEKRALSVFEKLIEVILLDESGLPHLPLVYLNIIRCISSQSIIIKMIASETEKTLLSKYLPVDAADTLVYTARIANISIEKKQDYLQRAEVLYGQGKIEDLIWGHHMLIPTFYRLDLWEEVVRCFENLFEQYIKIQNVDEYVETFMSIGQFRDKLDASELDRLGKLAISSKERINFSVEQESKLLLGVAKNYSYIADKINNSKEHKECEDLALEYYQKSLSIAPDKLACVVLHDTAVIYHSRGEYEKALKNLNEAVMKSEQSENIIGVAHSRQIRAQILTLLKRLDEAYSDYEYSLGVLQAVIKRWDDLLIASEYDNLNPYNIAEIRYDKTWLASSSIDFVKFLLARDNKDDLPKALAYTEQATRIFKEIEHVPGLRDAEALQKYVMSKLKEYSPFNINSERTSSTCPSCRTPIELTVSICPSCNQKICLQCRRAVEEYEENCSECGFPINQEFTPIVTSTSNETDAIPQQDSRCPNCNKPVILDDGYCENCKRSFCPNCLSLIDDNALVCPFCQMEFTFVCSNCGNEIGTDDTMCKYCGEKLDE